jgi:RNA polymerase sigma factor (sigma-70 family)
VATIDTDLHLVEQFSRGASDQAFAELVSRHADWIYSAARRMVRDPDLAEDVTQAVFIVLSQKSTSLLHEKMSVSGWLFKVTRYSAANAMRARARREYHERQAATMNSESSARGSSGDDPLWSKLEMSLDELVERLRPAERDAVLLRFYQRKSMAEVGFALGVSEDAAKKRVARAVERLREMLSAKGVAVPAGAALVALLIANTTSHAAPAAMIATCVAVPTTAATMGAGATAIASATATTTATSASAAGIAHSTVMIMASAKLKIVLISAAVACCLPIGVGIAVIATRNSGSLTPASTNTAAGNGAPSAASAVMPAVQDPVQKFLSSTTQRTPTADRLTITQNRVRCAANLKAIGNALLLHANDNRGTYPADLGTLVVSEDITPESFICPNSDTRPINRAGMSPQEMAAWVNANSDYGYIPGFNSAAGPEMVIVFERDTNEFGDGMNLLFGDGHVEFATLANAKLQIQQSIAAAAARRR